MPSNLHFVTAKQDLRVFVHVEHFEYLGIGTISVENNVNRPLGFYAPAIRSYPVRLLPSETRAGRA